MSLSSGFPDVSVIHDISAMFVTIFHYTVTDTSNSKYIGCDFDPLLSSHMYEFVFSYTMFLPACVHSAFLASVYCNCFVFPAINSIPDGGKWSITCEILTVSSPSL